MKLVEVIVENFRGIKGLTLPLGDLTVLIGENNTGKSTVLEAVRFVLARGFGTRRGGQLSEYDFHLADAQATPQTALPVRITLHFAEAKADEWPEAVVQRLDKILQVDTSTGLNHIWLLTTGTLNQETQSFETEWAFLNSSGAKLPVENPFLLSLLQRFVPLFFLSCLRDSSQEFGQRGQFWAGFLKSVKLPDEDRKVLEKKLQDINASVIAANKGLKQVAEQIANARHLVPLDAKEPVVLEAIPTRVFEMTGRVQVNLRASHGAKLPLQRHGEGTQSLAVLLLFQAFASVNLAETYEQESTPILALEEPESHLHPSAVRSLGTFLGTMPGQILVSSHSGDMVSRVPIGSIRRLYKHGGITKIGLVPENYLSDPEERAIDYSIKLTRGAYLFSRCWLFVEGESDFHLVPMLFEIMGYTQDRVSFSVIEISQAVGKGEPFMKLAMAMGIQWFMMVDGDMAGKDYETRAVKYLNKNEKLTDRVQRLGARDIEHEFWMNGFDVFIQSIVPKKRQSQIIAEAGGDTAKRVSLTIKAAIKAADGKPGFAQILGNEVKKRGDKSIPKIIRDIIARTVKLAGD